MDGILQVLQTLNKHLVKLLKDLLPSGTFGVGDMASRLSHSGPGQALLTQEHAGQVGLLPAMSNPPERHIVSGVPHGNASTFTRNVFTQWIPTPPLKQPQLWGADSHYVVGRAVALPSPPN